MHIKGRIFLPASYRGQPALLHQAKRHGIMGSAEHAGIAVSPGKAYDPAIAEQFTAEGRLLLRDGEELILTGPPE